SLHRSRTQRLVPRSLQNRRHALQTRRSRLHQKRTRQVAATTKDLRSSASARRGTALLRPSWLFSWVPRPGGFCKGGASHWAPLTRVSPDDPEAHKSDEALVGTADAGCLCLWLGLLLQM